MDAPNVFYRLSEYYHLPQGERDKGNALLAQLSGDDYVILGKCWLLSPDGYLWRFAAAGTLQDPHNPSSGVWTSDVVEIWTGAYMPSVTGQRKLLIMVPVPPQKYYSRGWRHPVGLTGDGRSFNPAIARKRPVAPLDILAAEGVEMARKIGAA